MERSKAKSLRLAKPNEEIGLRPLLFTKFFKQNSDEIEKAKQKLESIEDELLNVFSRWEELENLK